MSYRVIILQQAREDIARNSDWWAENHSLEDALQWSEDVLSQIASLKDFPESCPLSRENGTFPDPIRDKLVGRGHRKRYRAVFTIRDETVIVVAVRSTSQGQLRSEDVNLPDDF